MTSQLCKQIYQQAVAWYENPENRTALSGGKKNSMKKIIQEISVVAGVLCGMLAGGAHSFGISLLMICIAVVLLLPAIVSGALEENED